jgi:hypothetical protein
MLTRKAIDDGTDQPCRHGLGSSDPQFSRRWVCQELKLSHACSKIVEDGSAALEECVRYFKRVLWITEVNGRVSELRGKGFEIESSSERDPYGFVYLRLVKVPAPKQLSIV